MTRAAAAGCIVCALLLLWGALSLISSVTQPLGAAAMQLAVQLLCCCRRAPSELPQDPAWTAGLCIPTLGLHALPTLSRRARAARCCAVASWHVGVCVRALPACVCALAGVCVRALPAWRRLGRRRWPKCWPRCVMGLLRLLRFAWRSLLLLPDEARRMPASAALANAGLLAFCSDGCLARLSGARLRLCGRAGLYALLLHAQLMLCLQQSWRARRHAAAGARAMLVGPLSVDTGASPAPSTGSFSGLLLVYRQPASLDPHSCTHASNGSTFVLLCFLLGAIAAPPQAPVCVHLRALRRARCASALTRGTPGF